MVENIACFIWVQICNLFVNKSAKVITLSFQVVLAFESMPF